MDELLDQSYETCRRMHRRHDPTYYWATRRLPRGDPAGHARPLRLRAHGGRDRRRPAAGRASAEARRAALDAWERELHDGLAPGAPRIRSSARSSTPAAATGCRSASCAPTCARCGSTARRCGSRPGRSSRPTWTARRAPSGRIMAPLLGVPARHHAGYGRLGQAFQLANFIRDVREDTALDRIYLPAEDRSASASASATWRADHASPELRALLAMEVRRARGLFAEAEPAVAAAPASVRTGVRFAVGGLPARARPRRADRVRRARPRDRRARRGSCPARRWGRCAR